MTQYFNKLLDNVRSCVLCELKLEHGVRPVLQASASTKIVIAGQAPGSKVHKTGVPFDDLSGYRLRDWMGVSKDIFYDSKKIAILPMGFCYPGKGKSGDLPPLPICAKTWRQSLLDELPEVELTLAIGQYAQQWHLDSHYKNLTETVRNWRSFGPHVIPLPHPSPRNNIWLKKNGWFEKEVLPMLKGRVFELLNES